MTLLCLVVSGLAPRQACGQGTARTHRFIELSETNTAEILTNLNQLTTKKDGLRQLDDQLRLFNRVNGPKSLEQRFNAPYIPANVQAIPNKTIKELLERRQNWGLSPEELGTGVSSTDDEALSNYSEDPNANKSSLRQFYDQLNRPGSSRQGADRFGNKDFSNSDQRPNSRPDDLSAFSDDDSSLPPALRDRAKQLKAVINEDSNSIFNPTHPRSSFDNFFGVSGNNTAAAGVGGAPKTKVDSFLDQFKKGLDASAGLTRIDPALQSLLPAATSQTAAPVGIQSSDPLSDLTRHNLTASSLANPNAVVDHASLPNINAEVLNQWNPMYTPPKFELPTPKYTPPTPLNMEFPRRKF